MLHPVLCTNVLIRGVTVENPVANGDGIDLESCKDIWLKDCVLRCKDDGIVLKSGRNADGRRINVPCENVVVQDCRILGVSGSEGRPRNGIAVGSEISGGARNFFVENCEIANRLRGISLKSNSLRGGFLENLCFRNLTFKDIAEPVLNVDLNYSSERGPFYPVIRNVELAGSTGDGIGCLFEVDRPVEAPVSNVLVRDCVFTNVQSEQDRLKNPVGLRLVKTTVNGKHHRIGLAAQASQKSEAATEETSECTGPAASSQSDGEITVADVPQAVGETIRREFGDTQVDIGKKMRDGRVVYEVDGRIDGKKVEINIYEDGSIRSRK